MTTIFDEVTRDSTDRAIEELAHAKGEALRLEQALAEATEEFAIAKAAERRLADALVQEMELRVDFAIKHRVDGPSSD